MTRIEWIGYTAALIISCFAYDAKAQRYCYTLGADMAQCTDGTTAFNLGQGSVMVLDPPQQAPSVSVPPGLFDNYVSQTTTHAYIPTLITTPELIAADHKAHVDCIINSPGPLNTCHKREVIQAELAARGMCFGSVDQVKVDWRWHRCGG